VILDKNKKTLTDIPGNNISVQ